MRGLCVFVLGFTSACNAVFDIEDTKPRPLDFSPRTLVFDNSASQVDLVDFPVLVSLDAGHIEYEKVVDPSMDLRFEADGADLPFEIEHWDPDGVSAVWVKAPLIAAGSRTDHISMFYGPDAHGTESPADVWTAYDLVIHGDGDFHATVGASSQEVAGDVAVGTGQVGGAIHLSGSQNTSVTYAGTTGLLDGWSEYTVEMWLYADYASAVLGKTSSGVFIEPRYFEKPGAMVLGRLTQTGNAYLFQTQIDTHYQDRILYRQPYAPVRHWFHYVQIYDGTAQYIFGNGIVSDYIAVTPTVATAAGSGPLVLGSDQSSPSLQGMLDEIRISRHAQSPYWVEAQYKAMTGAFVTFFLPGEAP